jgi:hypothetical protein
MWCTEQRLVDVERREVMLAAGACAADRDRDELRRADLRALQIIVIGDERHATLKQRCRIYPDPLNEVRIADNLSV